MADPEVQVGQIVKCRLPGRRSFVAKVSRVREGEEAFVDVIDPRNGGLRTVRLDQVTAEKKAKPPAMPSIKPTNKRKGAAKK